MGAGGGVLCTHGREMATVASCQVERPNEVTSFPFYLKIQPTSTIKIENFITTIEFYVCDESPLYSLFLVREIIINDDSSFPVISTHREARAGKNHTKLHPSPHSTNNYACVSLVRTINRGTSCAAFECTQ